MKAVLRLIVQRCALSILTLLAVSLIIFISVAFLPGDIAEEILGQDATPQTVAALRAQLGLDQPPHWRYLAWLGNLVNGDLGTSLASRRPVVELIGNRAFNTLFLALAAAIIAVPTSLLLGVLAALYRNSWFDRAINIATLSSISAPEFFLAYLLIVVFSSNLGWFPRLAINFSPALPFGEKIILILLPALALTLVVVAHMMRMTRVAIINLLASPYIETAHLKGASPLRVIIRHAVPNALAPIINVIALNMAYLVVGVVVVEVVFAFPGLGQIMVDSVIVRDIPVVQACALIFAATYILLNLTADTLSILTNPRLLHQR